MKYIITLCLLSLLTTLPLNSKAQRFVYVDSDEILAALPEYQAAQKALDDLAEKWKSDIAKEYEVIKGMYKKYQASEVLLTDVEKKERQAAIVQREEKVRQLQKEKFGPEGDLFKKREELVRPVQDKIFNAIQKYAEEKNLDVIFDKANGASILFSNPRYEKTKEIINRIQ